MTQPTTEMKYNCPAMRELRSLRSNHPDMVPFINTAMSYLALFRDAHPNDYYAPEVELDRGFAPGRKDSVYLEWATPDSVIVVSFWDDGTTTFGRGREGHQYERHRAEGPAEALGMTHWPDAACPR